MNTSNWPGGVNRTSSNWTGRTQRVSESSGGWAPHSHAIPWREALPFLIIGAAAFLIFVVIGAAVF